MKYTFLFLLLFVVKTGFCQDGYLPLDKDKNIYYSDTATPELPKDSIFRRAQGWIEKAFGNYQNVVTLEAAEAGRLILTSYAAVTTAQYQYIRFDMTIDCADHELKVRINNLDGISTIHSPEKLGIRENDVITAKEQAVKTETNRKKKSEAEQALRAAKADNDYINTAMYKLLADLKLYVSSGETH